MPAGPLHPAQRLGLPLGSTAWLVTARYCTHKLRSNTSSARRPRLSARVHHRNSRYEVPLALESAEGHLQWDAVALKALPAGW